MTTASHRSAIIGIGETDFSRGSGRSEWSLAIDAISSAVEDAGLDPSDVDGLIRYTQDSVDEAMIVRSFGMNLDYYGQLGYGGLAAPATVAHAAAVIEGGLASVIVCYRALNGYSSTRFGRAERSLGTSDVMAAKGDRAPSGAFAGPYGLLAPGQVMALWACRYQHEAGLSDDDLTRALAAVAIGQRAYAETNPRAVMRKPLDYETYVTGRRTFEPFRLYDHALETDGAVAVVVASADVAASAPRPPAWVVGGVHGLIPFAESVAIYGELRNASDYQAIAERLYQRCGLRPADISAALLYDATSISVLLAYEAYGFAPVNKSWRAVIEEGIGLESRLPVNTNGGHLSEGYVHGMNLITEAVRQCRGVAANQVQDVQHVLCTSGPSAVVLAP